MQKEQFLEILKKHQEGKASEEEIEFLRTYYRLSELEPDILETIEKKEKTEIRDRIEDRLLRQISETEPAIKKRAYTWIAVAASILMILSFSIYFLQRPRPASSVVLLKPGTFKNDALPGNKAYLTLSNGKQITVTSLLTGQITANTDAKAQKTANGEIIYQTAQGNEPAPVFNTFTVPRGGGKHEIKLADGTLAVLDAESSIRFPVAFNGKERRVSITGQVYFEVVHNEKQPFYVNAGSETIEDIGTHFNVNTFDGMIKTTLIEGSIKVDGTLLKPGQQAIELGGGKLNILDNVDKEGVLAWKNDLFKFGNNTSLQTVMTQLSRWYDLDVVYEGHGKKYSFGGFVPRNSKLSEVCKILTLSGVQFSVDGKKIIVYQ